MAERRRARELYTAARCGNCSEVFANLFVLWRHRPQDVPPFEQRCRSVSQLYRLGMYRVAGKHKGEGIWHDDGSESPIGKVGVRGDEPRAKRVTEGMPDFGHWSRAVASSYGRI